MGEENLEILMNNQKPYNTYELFDNWVAKQPLPVEAAVNTVISGVYAGVFSFALNGLFLRVSSYPKIPSLHMACVQATLLGVHDGLNCLMNSLRGKEDIQTRMAAGFGSGVMASLVARVTGPHTLLCPRAIPFGVVMALTNGGLFKLEEKKMKKEEDLKVIE